jgi:CHAT domain-containing protein
VDTSIEAIRAARRELDDVIEEIRAAGHEDFLAAPTFDDIAAAASAEHPLIYFTAADPGGLALVVRGSEVQHVPLEGLSAGVLRKRVSHYLSTYKAYRRDPKVCLEKWRRELDQITRWLWPTVVGPVVDELGPITRAVFVPGGLLGLLPMHAAWTVDKGRPSGRRYALDSIAIAYTPNARALKAARVLARRPADRLLVVADPPHLPALVPLPLTRVEAELAEHHFTHAVVLRPEESTKDRVLAEVAAANVAHLACHGFAELQTPLESGLSLAGEDVLRLSDLLALKSELRLAVLSACETLLPGTELPDEVVSLPTGLLQAGVGGVVASQWAVPDPATALLMFAFYRKWRQEEMAPPDALRAAQLWLRDTSTSTKTELLVEAAAEGGPLSAAAVDDVLSAMLQRGAEDDSHIEAWAGFAYVGA